MNARLKAIELVEAGVVYRVVLETPDRGLLRFDFSVSTDQHGIVLVQCSDEFSTYTGMGWSSPTELIYRAVKAFHDAQASHY